MKYIIGNWKSNKDSREVTIWFETFAKLYKKNKTGKLNNLKVIICPSFVQLVQAKQLVISHNLPIKLGAQDVSPFANGPYTGEVSATQLKELVEYVVIGHSERRNNFQENGGLLVQKVVMAIKERLKPIFCIQGPKTTIPPGVSIAAYEPVWAIGSGTAETPENAAKIARQVKQNKLANLVVYGGSVTPENVCGFLAGSSIDGILAGGVSLDPVKFWQIIVNAASL